MKLSKLARETESTNTGSDFTVAPIRAGAMLVPEGKMSNPLCFSLNEVMNPSEQSCIRYPEELLTSLTL